MGTEMARRLGAANHACARPLLLRTRRSARSPAPPRGAALHGKADRALQTFADQAVIAIENARLFEEVQARTRELQESLEYQTATSDVLKVISRSPSTSSRCSTRSSNAARLCGAHLQHRSAGGGNLLHLAATHNFTSEALQKFRAIYPCPSARSSPVGRSCRRATDPHPDVGGSGILCSTVDACGRSSRHALGVPLLRDGCRSASSPFPRLSRSCFPKADRARHDLRRPGGDRDRERAAVRGGAGAHARAAARPSSSRPRPRKCSRSSAARTGDLAPVLRRDLAKADAALQRQATASCGATMRGVSRSPPSAARPRRL